MPNIRVRLDIKDKVRDKGNKKKVVIYYRKEFIYMRY